MCFQPWLVSHRLEVYDLGVGSFYCSFNSVGRSECLETAVVKAKPKARSLFENGEACLFSKPAQMLRNLARKQFVCLLRLLLNSSHQPTCIPAFQTMCVCVFVL